MKYLIKIKGTMEGSNLVELPSGSIPISVLKHWHKELPDGTVLVSEHWDVIYLEPYEETHGH